MADIEIRVSKQNNAKLDELGRDAKKAGSEVEAGLKKGFKGGEEAGDQMRKKVGADLDKTAKDAEQAGGKAGTGFGTQLGDKAGEAVSGGAGGIMDSLTESLKGGGAAGAAGLAIGAVLMTGITGMIEQGDIGGTLAAKLEGAQGQASRMGRIAGDVYADNFGDSLEDAASGIQSIMQNKLIDTAASDDAIRKMTGLVLTAAKVAEDEANNVARAARQMLVNGLAGSAEEAFDIIVAASQRGLNVNGDLIDTTVEYSTKFRDLGLSGSEAMGLIGQAMDAGARDTDTAADAMKEFAIRAQDGSDATRRGFEEIGLDAKEMGLQIAQGGDAAHESLRLTLNGLKEITNPVERNQAAVDLFGTKAEDLGDALFNMDLDTVAAQFGDVAGATSKASDSMVTTGSTLEGFGRQAKQVATDVTGWGVAALQAWTGNKEPITQLTVAAGDYGAALDENREAEKIRAREAASAWTHEQDSIVKVNKTLEENIQLQQDAAGVVLGLSEAEIRYQASVDDAAESLKKNKKNLDTHTEAGRENRSALNDMAEAAYRQMEAMEQSGATTEQVRGFTATAREEFVRTAIQMGMSAVEANRLADKLRLIPGRYTAEVGVFDANASNTIATIRGHLIDLTNRTWVASVAVTGGGRTGGGRYYPGMAHGGVVGRAAEGGPRGNWTMVGEDGPELVNLAPGSTVRTNADTERMMASGFGGGQPRGWSECQMTFAGNLDSMFATAWMRAQELGLIKVKVR